MIKTVHFTWRLIAEGFATELLHQGLLVASLRSVKTSLGFAYMLPSWASKREVSYIPTTLSDCMLNYFRCIFPPLLSTLGRVKYCKFLDKTLMRMCKDFTSQLKAFIKNGDQQRSFSKMGYGRFTKIKFLDFVCE